MGANGCPTHAVGLGGSLVLLRSVRVLVVFFVAIFAGAGLASGAGEGSGIANAVAVKNIRSTPWSFMLCLARRITNKSAARYEEESVLCPNQYDGRITRSQRFIPRSKFYWSEVVTTKPSLHVYESI